MKDMDRKLAAVVCQGFDDLQNVEAIFKMFDCFGNVLERRSIKKELQSRLPVTIKMFLKELDRTKLLYDSQMAVKTSTKDGYVPVQRNFPAVAGQIKWVREMKQKIERSFNLFKHPERKLDLLRFFL